MTRVKRGVAANKRRKNVLEMAKGYRWGRSRQYAAAKQAVMKAGAYAYRDRRNKKRTFRSLWIIRLGNALRAFDTSYSAFIGILKAKSIDLDRKALSDLAVRDAGAFKALFEKIKNT
ncbi:MAG: 50S ribosomal protein L20 [Candidatus Moranbacteria bacterium]|nr:50S ribosomal protein L20 [Candidatus Moranbacteria bacterium]